MSVPDPATVKDTLGAFVLLFAGTVLATLILAFEFKFSFIHVFKSIRSFVKRKDIDIESTATTKHDKHQHQSINLNYGRYSQDERQYI